MSLLPMPQNMARCLTTQAGYQSDGSGCRMEFRSSGWQSNGKRPTARLFQPQALLGMGQASFASFSHMNLGERLIFRLLPAASNVDWRFLLSGLVATMTPSTMRGYPTFVEHMTLNRSRAVACEKPTPNIDLHGFRRRFEHNPARSVKATRQKLSKGKPHVLTA